MPQTVTINITVNDQGAVVVKRLGDDFTKAAQEIERNSRQSFDKLATNTEKAVTSTARQLDKLESEALSTGKTMVTAFEKAGTAGASIDDGLGPLRDLLAKSKTQAAAFEESMVKAGVGGEAAAAGLTSSMAGVALVAGTAALGIGAVAYAAHELAAAADPVTSLRRGFETLTGRIDENAEIMLGKSRTATKLLVSDLDLMRAANEAVLLNIPLTSEKFAELAGGAVELGRAMNVGPTKALESMITGIGRQSNRLLDNIGIIVDASKAHEDFARSLGKSADQLTDAEKRTAFFDATLAAMRDKLRGVGGETLTFAEYTKMAENAVGNTKDTVLDFVNVGLGKMISGFIASSLEAREFAIVMELLKDSSINASDLAAKIEAIRLAGSDPGGMAIFDAIAKAQEPVFETGKRVADLRGQLVVLTGMLSEHREPEQVQIIRARVQQLNHELDALLGKTKDFTGWTGSVSSKLPLPDNSNAPFAGKNPFEGRVPGLLQDNTTRANPFDDKEMDAALKELVSHMEAVKLTSKSTVDEFLKDWQAISTVGAEAGISAGNQVAAFRDDILDLAAAAKASGVEIPAELQKLVESAQKLKDADVDADKWKDLNEELKKTGVISKETANSLVNDLGEAVRIAAAHGVEATDIYRAHREELERVVEAYMVAGDEIPAAIQKAFDESQVGVFTETIRKSAAELVVGFTQSWGEFVIQAEASLAHMIGQFVVFGGSISQMAKNLLKQIVSQMVSMLVQWGIAKIALGKVNNAVTAKEASANLASGLAQTFVNSFASAAAIPVVGWAMAPGVAATNLALASSGAAGAAALGAGLGAGIGVAGFAAEGALITRGPTPVMTGERGAEAIVPLTGEPARRAAKAMGIGQGGDGVTLHAHFTGDNWRDGGIADELLEKIYDGITGMIRRGKLAAFPAA